MFAKYYIGVLKQYCNFKGRASRAEYWWFVLFNTLIGVAIAFVGMLFDSVVFSSLYSLVVTLPAMAVMVRRLPDVGKNWMFLFINLLPIAGPLIMLYFLCKKGELGENQWGALTD